jgi:predicted ATPase
MPAATLKTLSLRNFKSFAEAEVHFENLTFIVGRNGAGKSNLLDALQFL